MDLAARLRVPVEDTICLDRPGSWHFAFWPIRLGYLEKTLKIPVPLGRRNTRIALVAAANRRVEAEGVAREILRLVRDEGYRYRDLLQFSAIWMIMPICWQRFLPIMAFPILWTGSDLFITIP